MGSNEVVEKEMSEVWWVVLQLYTEKDVNESLLCLLSTLPTNRLEMQLRLKGRILQVMKRSFREDYLVSSEPKPIGMLQARLRDDLFEKGISKGVSCFKTLNQNKNAKCPYTTRIP